MDINIVGFLLVLLILGIIVVIFLLLKKKEVGSSLETEKLCLMLDQLKVENKDLRQQQREEQKDLRQLLDSKLSETHRANQEQFGQTTKIMQGITGQSAKLISEVTEKLTKLDETNKQVVNFSAQLQSLQDILKNPKQRGILGEYYLETLLKNILPPGSYDMQYKLGKDEATGKDLIVDAVVFVKKKIIPIDSKFSLENYNRIIEEKNPAEKAKLEKLFVNDLKNRIQETAKYIQPEKNTMDFAFMFIPHEAIYYDLLINKVGGLQQENPENLIQRAASTYKVIIVSPTSFLAYLQTVLQGLNAMEIEEKAKDIIISVGKLGKHILVYDDYLKKLGSSLGTSVNHYNNAYKEFKKIDKDVVRIAGSESKIEPLALNKPQLED